MLTIVIITVATILLPILFSALVLTLLFSSVAGLYSI